MLDQFLAATKDDGWFDLSVFAMIVEDADDDDDDNDDDDDDDF